LIDACEDHYAEPLRRWRELRYLEMRETQLADQYDLPLGGRGNITKKIDS